jgi:MFS family permease
MTTLFSSSTEEGVRHRWILLLVLAGAMLLDSLDVTLLGIALPSVGRDFDVSPWSTQWALTGFPFGFGLALLPARSLVRTLGRRRTYLVALTVFAVASVISGLSGDVLELALAEAVKGVCAAVTAPLGMVIIATTFSDGPPRVRAALVFSLFGTAGALVGALLSGFVSEVSWRLSLSAAAPVALGLVVLGLFRLPSDPPELSAPATVRVPRSWSLLRSAVTAGAFNGASIGLFVLANFELQDMFGWRPWQAALAFLPAYAALPVSVLVARRIVARSGTAVPVTAGAVFAVAACAVYPVLGVIPSTVLLGLAYLLLFTPVNVAATAGLLPADQPAGMLTLQTAVQFGAVLIVPGVGAFLSTSDSIWPATSLVTAAAVVALAAAATDLLHPIREKGTR